MLKDFEKVRITMAFSKRSGKSMQWSPAKST